jgi:hypothetical protein
METRLNDVIEELKTLEKVQIDGLELLRNGQHKEHRQRHGDIPGSRTSQVHK